MKIETKLRRETRLKIKRRVLIKGIIILMATTKPGKKSSKKEAGGPEW